MEEKMVFDKINGLFEESGYTQEINDIATLEDFLNDGNNAKYSFYEEVEQLYNKLLGYEEEEQ